MDGKKHRPKALFEAVSKKLEENGVNYTADQCKTRLKNIRASYNKKCAGQSVSGSAAELLTSADDLLVQIFNTRPLARSSQLTIDSSFADVADGAEILFVVPEEDGAGAAPAVEVEQRAHAGPSRSGEADETVEESDPAGGSSSPSLVDDQASRAASAEDAESSVSGSAREPPRRTSHLSGTPRAVRRRQQRRATPAPGGPSELMALLTSIRQDDAEERRWRREESEREERRHQAQMAQMALAVRSFQQVAEMAGEVARAARYRPYP